MRRGVERGSKLRRPGGGGLEIPSTPPTPFFRKQIAQLRDLNIDVFFFPFQVIISRRRIIIVVVVYTRPQFSRQTDDCGYDDRDDEYALSG